MQTPRETPDAATERQTSVATERQIVRWLTSRGLPGLLDDQAGSLPARLKDGVLLADLLKGLDPQLNLTGFNRRVLSRGPAIANLELVLGAVWRRSALGKCMPSAQELYEGKRVFSLLRVIIEVYVLRAMRRRNRDLLRWIQKVLSPYLVAVPDRVMDADLDSSAGVMALWKFLLDGVALFCIAHSCWPASLRPAPHSTALYYCPQGQEEIQANVQLALVCLRELGVPILISAPELAACPADFILILQVHLVWSSLSNHHEQHAGLDTLALRDLRFKDHERLLHRLNRSVSQTNSESPGRCMALNGLGDCSRQGECRDTITLGHVPAKEDSPRGGMPRTSRNTLPARHGGS